MNDDNKIEYNVKLIEKAMNRATEAWNGQDYNMSRTFYRIRDEKDLLRHSFHNLDAAEQELLALHNGTHIASKLVPRPDFYIVKVTEIEEKLNESNYKKM